MLTRALNARRMQTFRGSTSRFANAVARGRQQRQLAVTAARAALAVARPMPMSDAQYPRTFAARPTSYGEIKSFDLSPANVQAVQRGAVAGSSPNSLNAGMICLNCGIMQGAAFYQRIGAKIMVKSVNAWFKPEISSTNLVSNASLRCMLVYDRQANGAYATLADILGINDTGVVTQNAGINMINKSRFSMIRDQVVELDAGAQYGKTVHWFCKGRWEVEYGTTTGGIADIRTGAFYFICFWDGQGVSGENPAPSIFDIEFRTRYFD